MPPSVDPQTSTPPPAGGPIRVLVVDDEFVVRSVARLMLERVGYAVEEASDAGEAITAVTSATSPFAAILLDYTLPDRVGTDVIPELRQLSPQSRIVLTSGRPQEDLPQHTADGFLAKPFMKEQLSAAIQAVLTAS